MRLQIKNKIIIIYIISFIFSCQEKEKINYMNNEKIELFNIVLQKADSLNYNIDSITVTIDLAPTTLSELKKYDPFGNIISEDKENILKEMNIPFYIADISKINSLGDGLELYISEDLRKVKYLRYK